MNTNQHIVATHTGLNDEFIRRTAPSIFASEPMAGVSDRYSFAPTSTVLNALRGAGWLPVKVQQQLVKCDHRRGFQKHVIRFQRDRSGVAQAVGEVLPELVLQNSHDRSSAYQLHAGLFRLVCSNGMVVSDATFERISLRHTGFTVDEVVEASMKVLANVPKIMESVETFRARQLTPAEALYFARHAHALRWENTDAAPVEPQMLLATRRTADAGNDLWRTLNRVQENLLAGGQKQHGRRIVAPIMNPAFAPRTRRAPRTQEVRGIDQSMKINRGLWELADNLLHTVPVIEPASLDI